MSAGASRAGTARGGQNAQIEVRNAWIVAIDGTVTERSYPLDWSARVHALEGIRDGLRRG